MKNGRKLTNEQAHELRVKASEGASYRALGKMYGISRTLAGRIAIGREYEDAGGPIQPKRGAQPVSRSRHTARKLTDAQAKEIRERYRDGETIKELARAFGMGTGAISGLTFGHTYKTAGGPIRGQEEVQLDNPIPGVFGLEIERRMELMQRQLDDLKRENSFLRRGVKPLTEDESRGYAAALAAFEQAWTPLGDLIHAEGGAELVEALDAKGYITESSQPMPVLDAEGNIYPTIAELRGA